MQFVITSEYAKKRLDLFLKEHLPDLSRSHLQKLVKDGQVTVNEEKVTPHHFLKEGDEVEAVIELAQELLVTANPEVRIVECDSAPTTPNPSSGRRGNETISPPCGGGVRGGVVCIIHEEPDFVVVNKPVGLVVHQGAGHKAPDTLVNGLLARYPEIVRVGDDLVRPGIMHRLDADVSGVMVVARTQDMFDHLKKQFKLHEVEKEYIAVVEGKVSPSSGTIEFAIAQKGARMVARPKGEKGRWAKTEYEKIPWSSLRGAKGDVAISHGEEIATLPTVARDDKYSLLRIVIHTGRTHQIRVHLNAKGWPIVGDKLYGKEQRAKSKEQESDALRPTPYASRLMLHARKLVFKDLTGKKRKFIIEPPPEFTVHISHIT